MRRAVLVVSGALLVGVGCLDGDVRAQRSDLGFKGYLVKVRSADGERPFDADALSRSISLALGEGWSSAPTDVALEFRVTSQAATAPATAAEVWTGVHRLHQTGLFERAEPLLPAPLQAPAPPTPPWYGECRPSWSGTSAPKHQDGALSDSTWSLGPRGANVFEAWKLPTAAGRDVVIAHPDTGYLNHPSVNGALLGRGFDFTARRNGALDAADEGRLQWPGHGTRTSSVIAGRPFALPRYWISGVAPAALIMPLKVAHRVVLLDRIEHDMDNLAAAIRAAALGDPNFVRRKADVISISLGGAPSKAVEEALALAEEANVIVLAAAGNQVPLRQVGFPARYGNVIAVAASNYDSSNWEFSSKGSAVAVAAPGQNVWTARYRQAENTAHHCIEPSSGTSYAVATTAGVAALWLSYRHEALARRPDLDLPRTFKALVSCTARPIEVSDAENYGGGIVNARALLEEPLPDPHGMHARQSPRCIAALRQLQSRAQASREPCTSLVALAAVVGDRTSAEALLFGDAAGPESCSRAGHLGDEVASLFARESTMMTAVHAFRPGGGRRAVFTLRQTILEHDISPQLRHQLVRVHRESTE